MFKKLFLIIIICILLFGILIFGFTEINCSNRYAKEKKSPDGRYMVQVEEENCGATVDYRVDVIIKRANSLFSNFGILSVWSGSSRDILAINGTLSSVNAIWVDNHTLKVEYSDCKAIHAKENSWKDIKIIYEGNC